MAEQNRTDLLLIVDMQKVYLPGSPWACPSMPDVEERICHLLDRHPKDRILFTRYLASKTPVGRWAEYNRTFASINSDPTLNELTEKLKPYSEHTAVYDKSTYSSLEIPEVRKAATTSSRVLLCGVVAECCILSTLLSLVDAGVHVIYLTDCISGQTPKNEEMIRTIAESFSPIHVELMTSDEYLLYLQQPILTFQMKEQTP